MDLEPFGLAHYRQAVHAATEMALQADKGIVLAAGRVDLLRHHGQPCPIRFRTRTGIASTYLMPAERFAALKATDELPLAVASDCERYLDDRLALLEEQLAAVSRLAVANELPDAVITESGLKITPLDTVVPETAQTLVEQAAMVPVAGG